jgi:hypothetical protein
LQTSWKVLQAPTPAGDMTWDQLEAVFTGNCTQRGGFGSRPWRPPAGPGPQVTPNACGRWRALDDLRRQGHGALRAPLKP